MAVEEMELDALLRAGVFSSKRDAIREALRSLFASRPRLKAEAAIQLFQDGEVTLGRAAEIAGVTRWELEEMLAERGIARTVESGAAEDLEHQVETFLHRG